MMIVNIVLGLVLLIVGAEFLVRGASRLARAAGLSPLVIGLTVVAYGTSAPEFAVSMKAGLAGQLDIALGNVVGSNIFNVLLILGASALITPLAVSRQLVRLDVPIMIAASVLTWICAANGSIGRWEGILGVLGIVAYTILLVRIGKMENSVPTSSIPAASEAPPSGKKLITTVFLVLVGLVLLVLGARYLVNGAVSVAKILGVSELVIGLTIVAAGTSMPETATSIVAAIRGERDIAVGNIVGSNIFNILAVLGASATIAPNGIAVAPTALRFDIPIMTAVALACLPIFFTGGRISRLEGLLFLAYYIAYIIFLVLTASASPQAATFGNAIVWFVLPLSGLGILLSVVYAIRKRRRPA